MNWSVKASPHFWRTALPLKEKYTHDPDFWKDVPQAPAPAF